MTDSAAPPGNSAAPPANAPPGNSAAPPANAPPADAAPWHGMTSPEDVAYIANKGWKGVGDIFKSYRSAETLIGKDPNSVVAIPRAGDQAGWDSVYARLGRPESADKYDLKAGLPEGAESDSAFMTSISNVLFKAGLSAEQAKTVATGYNEMLMAQQAQAATDHAANLTADKQMLQQEWGGAYERNKASAVLAVQELGFTEAEVSALEDVLGYRGVMVKLADLGKRLGDPKYVSSSGQPAFSGTLSPVEAGEEIRKMKMDKAFSDSLLDKFHPAHKENKERWDKMHRIAYPS